MAASVGEQYRNAKTYYSDASKKLRAQERGDPKRADPVTSLKVAQRADRAEDAERHREETNRLNSKLEARRGRERHLSFDDDDGRQRLALHEKHRAENSRRDARHRAELDDAMRRHMPV